MKTQDNENTDYQDDDKILCWMMYEMMLNSD